ncbi:MAG: MFS transporter, partial [Bosea sp. (in: a-proteobacteria)]
LVPMAAPILGGLIETWFGWRGNFLLILVAVALLAAVVAFQLPETLKARRPESISVPNIVRGFGILLQSRDYRTYVALTTFSYTGLFCFISASSFVLQGTYRMTPSTFGLSFGLTVLGYISGTIVAQRLLKRMTLDAVIRIGVGCLAAGGILMLLGMTLGPGSPVEVALPMALYVFGVGLVLPQANASAMMPFPDRAGAASSLQGLIQMTLAAAFALAISPLVKLTPLVLPVCVTLMGIAAAIVVGARLQTAST